MNVLYVVATAITVSVDSLIAGFSLSLNKRAKLTLPLTVALVTYLLCLLTSVAGLLLKDYLQDYVKFVGAVILYGLGIANFCKQEDKFSLREISFSQCLAIGFGVGLDGAAANLSLVLQGMGNLLLLPLLFAVTHFATVYTGQWLGSSAKLERANVFSAAMFFVLATVKLMFD